jgi:hypothetical protein
VLSLTRISAQGNLGQNTYRIWDGRGPWLTDTLTPADPSSHSHALQSLTAGTARLDAGHTANLCLASRFITLYPLDRIDDGCFPALKAKTKSTSRRRGPPVGSIGLDVFSYVAPSAPISLRALTTVKTSSVQRRWPPAYWA